MLILTVHAFAGMAREALGAGAHGYVAKSAPDTDLVAAEDALRQHKPFFPQHGAAKA